MQYDNLISEDLNKKRNPAIVGSNDCMKESPHLSDFTRLSSHLTKQIKYTAPP